MKQGFQQIYSASSTGPVGTGLYTSADVDGADTGGHAVVLIGYGEYTVSGITTQYWVMENSWGYGAASHDQGVFYLDMNVDWCVVKELCDWGLG